MDQRGDPGTYTQIVNETDQWLNRTIIERYSNNCPRIYINIGWYYGSIAVGAVATILNIYVIIAVILKQRKSRWKHKPSLLVMSLAFTDLILGVCCLLVNALPFLLTQISHLLLIMNINTHIMLYSLLNGLLHVFSMTVERFLAIRFPLIYKNKMTNKKVLLMVLANWLLAFLYLFHLLDPKKFLDFVSVLIFVIGTCLLMIYVYVFYNIRKIMTQRRNSVAGSRPNNNYKKELISAIYCVAVVLAFILCSFPNAINQFRVGQCDYMKVDFITSVVIIGNTVFNPLLWILSEKCMGKQRKIKRHMTFNASVSLSVISNQNQNV